MSRLKSCVAAVFPFLTLSAFLAVHPCAGADSSGEATTTMIVHEGLKFFVPRARIIVMAKAKDTSGIKIARCYFRTAGEADFVFVSMDSSEGNHTYRGVLPAPHGGTESVEYLFLVVNGNDRVMKTKLYIVTRGEGEEAPPWQESAAGEPLTISTETAASPEYIAGFSDSIIFDVSESAVRLGAVGGGYSLATESTSSTPAGSSTASTASAGSTSPVSTATTAASSGGGASSFLIGTGIVAAAGAFAFGAYEGVQALEESQQDTADTPEAVDTPVQETLSVPARPTGTEAGTTDTWYEFTTSATSNLGHQLEYMWRVESDCPICFSSWATNNTFSHFWFNSGTHQLWARARCVLHPDIITNWSDPHTVNISR